MLSPEAILGPNGLIARRLPHYEHRPQQLDMARAVHRAIQEEHHLLVEAGTGVGKSFAYLVPAIIAATAEDHPRRVIVSTHTITLQEQLISKDIPFLQATLPMEFTAVLAKGRTNYLSKRRFYLAVNESPQLFNEPDQQQQLERLAEWVARTSDGSKADLPFTPREDLWSVVRSEPDNCLFRKCPHFSECFFFLARRRIHNAQIVVVNHSLYFWDLELRRSGASILPDHHVVIFDEAHTLEEVASRHFGLEITTGQFLYNLLRLFNPRRETGLLASVLSRKLTSSTDKHDVQEQALRLVELVKDAQVAVKQFFADLRQELTPEEPRPVRLSRPPR